MKFGRKVFNSLHASIIRVVIIIKIILISEYLGYCRN